MPKALRQKRRQTKPEVATAVVVVAVVVVVNAVSVNRRMPRHRMTTLLNSNLNRLTLLRKQHRLHR
jgi:hypothetical protein